MKAHPPQQPDAAHQRKRYAADNQQRFAHPTERQIQQHEDNHQRHRHHEFKLMVGALQ
ncbi:hypothetical protein HMPREF0549_0583 [Limosilactobacillus vaginalis DSM 5837 = ATCC 49540]|uniref:Uncharacterized protein n=1 Tax=Limosilactobacillus vaginalis DSM 5837 = ATCC 49540 TaxID=1423814 RepID=C2ESZ7_9LACO|nr:hypothetical protein HMPREF0549_0583 [Limosilactobacillus vaginalis DSM 5837 = ATCC 49540]